ncbi:tRNA isopentenyltransferase [Mycena floridula]|nr:tRNA isopentenyltransferase [Mycena floridula]
MSLRPLIVICGTTGVGKSNLAIELALKVAQRQSRARIINADAMQVYAGMDIITNKVTEEERRGVEHLLMGFKQPGQQYVVGQWVKDAMQLIDETHSRSELPVIVGGTSYWIQHLLFPDRLVGQKIHSTVKMSESLQNALSELPLDLLDLFNSLPEEPPTTDLEFAFALHDLLARLDPDVAARWHWKDSRKVLRSLRILKDTGRKASEIIAEQSQHLDVKPRYHTLCFWLCANTSVLQERLDSRVDTMIERGLLDEVKDLLNIAQGDTNDYSLGIFQSIGYREFHEYLKMPEPTSEALAAATERMKTSTRQYATRQVRWIRNKLLPLMYAANKEEILTRTYLLDATDLETWSVNVLDPAVKMTTDFLDGTLDLDPLALSDMAREMLTIADKVTDPVAVLQARKKIVCPTCTIVETRPVMLEEGREWEAHQHTKAHKRMARPKPDYRAIRLAHGQV